MGYPTVSVRERLSYAINLIIVIIVEHLSELIVKYTKTTPQ